MMKPDNTTYVRAGDQVRMKWLTDLNTSYTYLYVQATYLHEHAILPTLFTTLSVEANLMVKPDKTRYVKAVEEVTMMSNWSRHTVVKVCRPHGHGEWATNMYNK